jgi:hypothetical protein
MVRKRLGEMLLEAGVIDETQLQSALGHQRKWGGKLGQALLDLKLATEAQVVSALSRKFGYDLVDVRSLQHSPKLDAALKLVPADLALRQVLLPIASDAHVLTVAMADPSNISVIDELSFRTGRRVRIALAGDRELTVAIRRLYFGEDEATPVAAIALDEPSTDSPMETTGDPFAAMPDQFQEGYFDLSTHGLGPDAQHTDSRRPAPASPPPLPAATAPGAQPAAVPEAPTFTPAPTLARSPATPAAPGPRGTPAPSSPPAWPPPPPRAAAGPPSDLGEPILATELAPAESAEGHYEEPPSSPLLTPRQAALLDAIERAARGEETGLVKPAQLAAVLARLLVKRGLVREAELLDELAKKRPRVFGDDEER